MRRLVWVLAGLVLIVVIAYAVSTQLGDEDDDKVSSAASTPVPTEASRTAPVPAPSGGSSDETVSPGRPVATVDAGSSRDITHPGGVTVRIDDVKIVKIEGTGPGQISGPAAAVKLTITNGSKKSVDPSSAVVTLLQGKDYRVATPTTTSPAKPFSGSLEPGESAAGTYLFELSDNKLGVADLVVQYQTGGEVARFHL